MIRTLLTTTALIAVLAIPAIGQDTSSAMDSSMMSSSMEPSKMSSSMMDSSMMSSSMMDSSMMSSSMMDSSMMSSSMEPSMMSSSMMDSAMSSEMPMAASSSEMAMDNMSAGQSFDIMTGYNRVDTDRLVTRVIGQPVYDGSAADANNLGNINDLVLDASGNIAAVVIGVGGFLGLGEKQVAVDYDALKWVMAADNTQRFVVETTVDQLTAAPDFVTVENGNDASSSMMDSSAM